MRTLAAFFVLIPLLTVAQEGDWCLTVGEPIETTTPRTNDFYYVSAVVHILHRQNGAFNITDAQVYSAIESANQMLRDNDPDPKIRIRLAAITRQSWTDLYDNTGITPGGYTGGESAASMITTFGWSTAHYYNIYLVWSICGIPANTCNWGGAGVQAWATFPSNFINTSDGTVQLINTFGARSWGADAMLHNLKTYTEQNKTFIHEFGHALNLRHTFQSTSSCTSETNCATQGDWCCDTPPHPQTSSCTPNCTNAPVFNYMSYSPQQCRMEFTPCQVDIMRGSFTLLQRSSQNANSPAPVSACAGDVCADAIPMNLCEWYPFSNIECNVQDYTGEGMSSMVGNCVNTLLTTPCPVDYTHFGNIWFTFDWTGGYVQIIINSNYAHPNAPTGNFGVMSGIQWTLWYREETCMESWAVTGSTCGIASYCNPAWVTFMNGTVPYDPTRQNWDLATDLPAGSYYIELSGFSGAYFANGQNHTYYSTGSGQVMVCGLSPLNLPLTLWVEGEVLRWSPDVAARVQKAETDWLDVGFGVGEFRVTKCGIYRVVDYSGKASHHVQVRFARVGTTTIWGLDGKEGARFGVAR